MNASDVYAFFMAKLFDFFEVQSYRLLLWLMAKTCQLQPGTAGFDGRREQEGELSISIGSVRPQVRFERSGKQSEVKQIKPCSVPGSDVGDTAKKYAVRMVYLDDHPVTGDLQVIS